MATIRPFKALRPDTEFASQVAALPYDVMTSLEAREIAKDNPYSFLHVDKAEIDLDPSIDLYSNEVYEKAYENLITMINNEIFISEDKPSLYIYRLTMGLRVQTGLVACTSIDEYLEGKIKKHELTREDKEQDRIRHVDTCNANTGPIFLAYPYQKNINEQINSVINSNNPIYDFESDDGIKHTVWIINDDEAIALLIDEFSKVESLYIADGHHRNASAVKVGMMRRDQNPSFTGDEEFNYYLSVIFPDTELKIFDYNRVVKDLNGHTEDELIDKIKEKFDVELKGSAECYRPEAVHTFGMYLSGCWYKLTAKQNIINEADPVASLDVSILQNELLKPILAIDDPRIDKRIDFVGGIRGLEELKNRVDSKEMAVAFSMHPTSIQELMNIADEGKIMPPKSTWFEPKLRSGLFIHLLD